ncbi:interferon regulatory factor 10 [Salminus brasiliensis]|uniref:interferon regulatory factor 10 n=1 Tax=Salminus brasiliensis TaxID=930266 RepID=UPI003B837A48
MRAPSAMEEKGRHMRLREWLIAQIDSGQYAGLSWENPEKTLFKIPWKHAAKQDYRQDEDAALFRAWAVYKGKYREGKDKPDPSAWKTRLRCALNKSMDFQEVPERSQLDISEPYKVYRVLEDTEKPTEPAPNAVKAQISQLARVLREPNAVQGGEQAESKNNGVSNGSAQRRVDGKLDLLCTNDAAGYENSSAPVYFYMLQPQGSISDFRLQVRLLYHGHLVKELISLSAEGCFVLQGSPPVGSERIYGPCAAEKVFFPPLDVMSFGPGIVDAMSRLLPHLEKGVLVWVAPDGVYIKRFCQGRVYWDGPLAEHREKPNKLERERTCKLMDMQIFLQELHRHLHSMGPKPRYEIDLCFGEEFPDSSQPKSKKLITAQVVPLFAKELFQRFSAAQDQSVYGRTSTEIHNFQNIQNIELPVIEARRGAELQKCGLDFQLP